MERENKGSRDVGGADIKHGSLFPNDYDVVRLRSRLHFEYVTPAWVFPDKPDREEEAGYETRARIEDTGFSVNNILHLLQEFGDKQGKKDDVIWHHFALRVAME